MTESNISTDSLKLLESFIIEKGGDKDIECWKDILIYLLMSGKGCYQSELTDATGVSKSKVSICLADMKEIGIIQKVRRGKENFIRFTEDAFGLLTKDFSESDFALLQNNADVPAKTGNEIPHVTNIIIEMRLAFDRKISLLETKIKSLENSILKTIKNTNTATNISDSDIKNSEPAINMEPKQNFSDPKPLEIMELLKKRIHEKRAGTKEKIVYELLNHGSKEAFRKDIECLANIERTTFARALMELKNSGWVFVKKIIDHNGQKDLIGLNIDKIKKEELSFMKISNEERIENILQSGDYLQSEIASKLDIPTNSARHIIKKMVKEGIVTVEFINPSKKMVRLAKSGQKNIEPTSITEPTDIQLPSNDIQEKVADTSPIKKKETPITPDANFGVSEEEQYKLSDEQKFVLKIILKNPKGLNQTIIGKKTGFDPVKIREILPILRELRLVKIERYGRENFVFPIREKIEEAIIPEEINKDKVEKAVAKAVSYLVAGESFKIANLFSMCMIGKEYFNAVIEAIKIEFPIKTEKESNFMECLIVSQSLNSASNPKKIETIIKGKASISNSKPLKKLGPSLAEIALNAEKELEQNIIDLLRGKPMNDEEIICNLSKFGKTINSAGIHRMFNRINNNGGPKILKEEKEDKIYYTIVG
ncbi:hypothetical protein KJ854_00175 [Patescibacteria group bacterium]|nr:hypothetical protein [Patescibacteria group bacterium]